MSETENNITLKGDKLVFSLPNADDPVVWQMDLEAHSSCAFEVKTKAKKHVLIMKDAVGKASDIATFSKKENAVSALMQITNALNDLPSAEKTKTAKNPKMIKRMVTILGLLITILILMFVWASMLRSPQIINDTQVITRTNNNVPASQSSGVPVSADDFLAGQ